MSAFLTSLASIGSQYGEAKDETRKEQAQSSLQQSYLKLAQQQEERQRQEFEQRKKTGDLIEFKDGRIWSVSKGQFLPDEGPDPASTLKTFIGQLDPRVQKLVVPKSQAIAAEFPHDRQGLLKAMLNEADRAQAEVARQDAAAQAETNRREDAATRHQEHEEDVVGQREFQKSQRAELESFMKGFYDYRNAGLTPAAEKVVMSTQPTLQQIDRLQGDIKKLGLESNNQNGYLFRARLKYALGQASPEGTLADDIAGLSLGSVIEAGSAMQGTSRSIIALKKALVHTPNPWIDSPMLINHKLTEIRRRLDDVVADAKKYGTKRGVADEDTPPANGPMDPAVTQYLQSIGVH